MLGQTMMMTMMMMMTMTMSPRLFDRAAPDE
jgi:hypothetical protein